MEMKKRYRSVDILKGVAMIMVILVHYGQNYQLGIANAFKYLQMGCPVFFVASGFGIMCLIHNKFGGRLKKENIKSFYLSRVKALAPGWTIAIAIVFLVNTVLLHFTGQTLSFGTNRDALSILCNLLFLNGLLPFCNNTVMAGGWYIGTTAILYALTPVILKCFDRAKNKRVFCAASSFLGMGIWAVLYFIFRDAFTVRGFGYFFFLVHYPEYLLGMLLYEDFTQRGSNDPRIKRCIPLSAAAGILAVVLFYLPPQILEIPSAWLTGLAAYYALYYLLSNEREQKSNAAVRILEKFGKNSYCIFLLHAFFAWPFVKVTLILLEKIGVPEIVSFFVLIPVTLSLAYFAGFVLHELLKRVNRVLFSGRSK